MWTLTDKNTDLETYLKRQRQNVMLTNFLKIPIETDMNSKRLKETVKKIPIETDMNSKRLKETDKKIPIETDMNSKRLKETE